MTPKSDHLSRLGPVLVTGGAGFIGSHVVDALLARGIAVRVLDDLSSGRSTHLPLHDPNLELVTGDILDPGAVASALRGMRACIHLAGRTRAPAGADPYTGTLGNLLGFINVLEAARRQKLARLAYASSASVYGEAPLPPFSEKTLPRPVTPNGIEKLLAEGYAELFRRRYRLSVIGLRYFNVYGPRQHAHSAGAGAVARFLERLEQRRPALIRGDGRQLRDYIHVEDAAQATLAALASRCRGAVNVGTGVATSTRELVRQIGQALDLQPLMHFVPAAVGEVAACWADTTRLRAEVGFTGARSLPAGLAEIASDRAARQRLQRDLPMLPPLRVMRVSIAPRLQRSLS